MLLKWGLVWGRGNPQLHSIVYFCQAQHQQVSQSVHSIALIEHWTRWSLTTVISRTEYSSDSWRKDVASLPDLLIIITPSHLPSLPINQTWWSQEHLVVEIYSVVLNFVLVAICVSQPYCGLWMVEAQESHDRSEVCIILWEWEYEIRKRCHEPSRPIFLIILNFVEISS